MQRSTLAFLAATALVICLVLGLSAFFVAREIASAPADLLERGGDALADLAAAFADRAVEIRFASEAVEIAGSQFLQFATLEETEIFERIDSSTVLWGTVTLPDVVVEARAPITYTYAVDLQGRWQLDLVDGILFVTAPAIEANEPAIDVSSIEYRIKQDSLVRDSDAALAALRRLLTDLARRRAADNIDLVRDTGRRQVEEFVRAWLVRDYEESRRLRIEVRFADEPPSEVSDALRLPSDDGAPREGTPRQGSEP